MINLQAGYLRKSGYSGNKSWLSLVKTRLHQRSAKQSSKVDKRSQRIVSNKPSLVCIAFLGRSLNSFSHIFQFQSPQNSK